MAAGSTSINSSGLHDFGEDCFSTQSGFGVGISFFSLFYICFLILLIVKPPTSLAQMIKKEDPSIIESHRSEAVVVNPIAPVRPDRPAVSSPSSPSSFSTETTQTKTSETKSAEPAEI